MHVYRVVPQHDFTSEVTKTSDFTPPLRQNGLRVHHAYDDQVFGVKLTIFRPCLQLFDTGRPGDKHVSRLVLTIKVKVSPTLFLLPSSSVFSVFFFPNPSFYPPFLLLLCLW